MFTLKMIPRGVFWASFSTRHVVLDVPMKWYNDSTPQPKEFIGPSLIYVSIVDTIPAFGKAALIAGDITLLYSCSVRVQAGSGYLSLAHILVCNAVHASLAEGFPNLILLPHYNAFCFKTLINFFLFPSGANQIPNISAAWSHLNLFSDTCLISESVAIKSTSKQLSVPTHFPRFQT